MSIKKSYFLAICIYQDGRTDDSHIFSLDPTLSREHNSPSGNKSDLKVIIIARRAIVFARYRLGQGKRCVNRVRLSVRPSWCRQIAKKCDFRLFGMHISGGKITTRVRIVQT